ncbi:glycosyl hydrolase family 95 catalytic domain-containing protein [Paenibacillus glucanolyticus]|uniref:glycosyl hydrolase family 95 catalytic domain-containing protein n=1 Tax=Paenibacillus glucanolyticus TaxID=59843 RepID=UPI000A66AE61|nr:hypothetical protein [Paenibacillus glucanolyticus]
MKAAQTLGRDEELQQKWQTALDQLPPLRIGKQGQLQEWLEDYEEAQPEHRHLAHLFALYPGSQITPHHTPELAAAARVTLENRNSPGRPGGYRVYRRPIRSLLRPTARW